MGCRATEQSRDLLDRRARNNLDPFFLFFFKRQRLKWISNNCSVHVGILRIYNNETGVRENESTASPSQVGRPTEWRELMCLRLKAKCGSLSDPRSLSLSLGSQPHPLTASGGSLGTGSTRATTTRHPTSSSELAVRASTNYSSCNVRKCGDLQERTSRRATSGAARVWRAK